MDTERLRSGATSPAYWQYDGEPVLLLGGTKEDNLFQIPDLETHLDDLVDSGGNYVRCTMSSRDEGNVWPYERVAGEGDDATYDLDRWNETYWERFEQFLDATYERDVIVQVEVWAPWDFHPNEDWERNAYNPANNRNYTYEESGLPERSAPDPEANWMTFFWSVPELGDFEVVRAYQERFLERLLDVAFPYPHVLYCMDNETSAPPEWSAYWADRVVARARREAIHVETTEMIRLRDIRHPWHWSVYDHPERFTFCDVSQNTNIVGEEYWQRIQWVREYLETPRPLNNVKIYGSDDPETWSDSTTRAVRRFWRDVFGGVAAARFHRPAVGIGLNEHAQRAIRGARDVTDGFDVFACEPRLDLLGDRDDDEAYLLADPGEAYAVYFPDGGSVTLSVESGEDAECRWYDADEPGWAERESLPADDPVRLDTPGDGQWAVVVELSG